jgi:hypothetical protein
MPATLASALTPEALAASREPDVHYVNRHFVVSSPQARVWIVRGLDGGAWPHFYRRTSSYNDAHQIVLDELLGHVEYLNDMVVRDHAARDEAERRAEIKVADLREKLAHMAVERDALKGIVASLHERAVRATEALGVVYDHTAEGDAA